MANKTCPPSWCKDAVPTPRGWTHPKTGELLVSTKLDMSLFEKKEEEAVKVVAAPVVTEEPVSVDNDEEYTPSVTKTIFKKK